MPDRGVESKRYVRYTQKICGPNIGMDSLITKYELFCSSSAIYLLKSTTKYYYELVRRSAVVPSIRWNIPFDGTPDIHPYS